LIKGLILSGGAGTRLRPLTHTSAKQLVPVANKPVIFYGIESLVNSGIKDIGIIISPETGEEIKKVVGDGSKFNCCITYILQEQPKGLAHAVLTAKQFIGDSDFVMYLGDNILRDGIESLVNKFKNKKPDSLILLTKVENPSAYGIAELDGGKIKNLEEKPLEPKSNLALVGVYIFTNKIFDAAARLLPSKRGELEITEAIQDLIDSQLNVEYEIVDGWWKDTGTVLEMLHANRLVLESFETKIEGDIVDADLHGTVIIEKGAQVKNSTIIGPAIIGKDSVIEDAYIGPYTAIDCNAIIKYSEIEYSIVLAGTKILGIDTRIHNSLIGKNVSIESNKQPPKTLSFVVGENSAIEIA
jgi:glucose-1-phosphate thymidylyltransferase